MNDPIPVNRDLYPPDIVSTDAISVGDKFFHLAPNHMEPVTVEAFDGAWVTYTRLVGGRMTQRCTVITFEASLRLAEIDAMPIKIHASQRPKSPAKRTESRA